MIRRKLAIISAAILVILAIGAMIFQFERMENARILEERRQEVMDQLANHLSRSNPLLDAFVDDNYRTTMASTISSEGICEFDRGLAKNQAPFGNYRVKYDLKHMKIISEELEVTYANYAEEWRTFEGKNNHK